MAEDPRGTKRSREESEIKSEEPVIKCARIDAAATAWEENQKALSTAITDGNLVQVEKLLKQSPRLRDARFPDHFGLTPLCLAAHLGQAEIISVLFRAGASVEGTASNGSTPLMFAAESGYAEVVRKLCLLGANCNAINPRHGASVLCFAVQKKQFEACKQLIKFGARIDLDIYKRINATQSRLRHLLDTICSCDFTELIEWMIDTGKMQVDSTYTHHKVPILYFAARHGAVGILRLLIQRGAKHDIEHTFPISGDKLLNVWDCAAYYSRCDSIERLLALETCPRPKEDWYVNTLWRDYSKKEKVIDVMNHLSLADEPKVPADKLRLQEHRNKPWLAIESLAKALNQQSFSLLALQSFGAHGWLIAPIAHAGGLKILSTGVHLLSARSYSTQPIDKPKGLTFAQMKQRLLEHLSHTLCSPEYTNPFSGLRLTPQGEQRMNPIAEAQGVLLLKGIAYLREQFNQQVATLPDICMNTYITLSHQVNKPDLYRRMTKTWGLYDPIARAALRLVEEAYVRLRELKPEKMTAEFAAMSPVEQLRHVIVDRLEAWDKISEIVEAMRKCETDDELEIVAELLFQQWRLFGEVFGVARPRVWQFGPHNPLEREPESMMEVDVPLVAEMPIAVAESMSTVALQ
jgi:ankyrin repeat protein